MRAVLWFLALFAIAVATTLFAGNDQGTVTLFWPPYRVDLSLNLVVLGLVLLFFILYVALRAISVLLSLPAQARRWRIQHQERAIHEGLIDTLSHLAAGRFVRARKAAEGVLAQERALTRSEQALPYGARLRTLAHLLAAESAHALQDRSARDEHVRQALERSAGRLEQEVRDGLQLRAARWAFDDRDVQAAQQRLGELSLGASRRTLALRLRFKVERLGRQTREALETARLLAKHRAFSPVAAQSLVRGLALELVQAAHDPSQLEKAWGQLDAMERQMPEVAIQAAERMLALGGAFALAQQWLLPVWDQMVRPATPLSQDQRIKLALVLEHGFSQSGDKPDVAWLTRIESAQMGNPRDALLQYLAGVICMHLSLWGKAQQLLKQALSKLQDERLRRRAWQALALLAEQREDLAAATDAWRNAAKARE
jgi:HemY protein